MFLSCNKRSSALVLVPGAAPAGTPPPRERAYTSLAVAFPDRGLSGVRHLDPPLVGRSARDVAVVPVPPLVRRGLRIAFRRVLPRLRAPERSHVELSPGAPHRLVAAAVDEVGTEDTAAVTDEDVGAVPLTDAEVG